MRAPAQARAPRARHKTAFSRKQTVIAVLSGATPQPPRGIYCGRAVKDIVTAWAREVAASRGVRIVTAPPSEKSLSIAVGSDHGGLEMKEQVKAHLTRLGYRFHDFGTH